MSDTLWLWAVAGIVVLALVVTVVVVRRRRATTTSLDTGRRRRPHRNEFRPPDAETAVPLKRAAVIVNPTKFADLTDVRWRIGTVCLAEGFDEPIWLETTAADPGTGQARQAVTEGAVLVCALGGDGTVRSVAAGLVGTETPMGLLPGGTGNLLARNLDLPVDSITRALVVALTGQNQRIDVGRLTVDRSGSPATPSAPEEHLFLVMAGMGFDAEIMAGAPERLKAQVGPAAYVVSGLGNLIGRTFKVTLKFGPDPSFSRRTRSVVIGNCGRLLGGLTLMPDARVDDGLLDIVTISPRGPIGWTAVAGKIITRSRRGHALVDHHTAAEVSVRAERSQEVQVDGDTIGPARGISARVEHLALVVRVAQKS
ncbi:diacylglycerol kinase family protein [Lapillicoccus sp.]|uniref:diacylglycerol/lipid kinase family protein n=1 Tax=Lapillicoccus sp. TaxID=1909287 RepID=UPI0025DB3312|nr:diacylglycerol kinase family protein [Lapillicoccus sp.]